MRKVAFFPLLSLLLISLLPSCGGDGGGGETTTPPGSAPIVATAAASTISENGATLNGTVNPNGAVTRTWFEYGTDPGLRTPSSSPGQDAGSGLTAQPASADLISLTPGTTYYFRICAESSGGYSEGQILSFATASPGSPPAVATVAATSVGASGATLNGSVIPNGLETEAWFEWGTDPALAAYTVTGTQPVGSGITSQTIAQALSGLAAGSMYYFRAAASNGSGTRKGTVLSFRPGAPPAATTLTATSVGAASATLNGTVNPNGLPTDAWFEWGTSPNLAAFEASPVQALGSGTASLPVTATLSGLSTGTTYYYRVVATNASGTVNGSSASFVTASSFFFGIVSTTPADNATDVALGAVITVTFNLDVEIASLVGAITVESALGNLPGVTSYNYATKTATFAPAAPFAPLTDYTVTVDTKVKSADDVRLSEPYVFGFKTGSAF